MGKVVLISPGQIICHEGLSPFLMSLGLESQQALPLPTMYLGNPAIMRIEGSNNGAL